MIVFSFDLKHFEIVGKHLPDDRIQRNFMPHDDIVKNIIYYSSIKSAVNVGPIKKNMEIIHPDEKKIESQQQVKKEETKKEEIETKKEETKKEEIKKEAMKKKEIVESKENIIEENIKENVYYNSDDEMLKELGDSL